MVYKLNDNKTAFFTNYADTNAELKKGRQHERIKKGGSLFFQLWLYINSIQNDYDKKVTKLVYAKIMRLNVLEDRVTIISKQIRARMRTTKRL